MAKARKVTQICLGGEGCAELYILCDDGTVWHRVRSGSEYVWTQVKINIPDAG